MDGTMKTQKNEQRDGVLRDSSLIGEKTRKMALTYIGSSVCMAAVAAAEALEAAVILGLTDTADYDRALDLNHLSLHVNPHVK